MTRSRSDNPPRTTEFQEIAPDECAVMAVADDRIEISLKSWGFRPRIVRLNWLLANQLAADLRRVVEEARVVNRDV